MWSGSELSAITRGGHSLCHAIGAATRRSYRLSGAENCRLKDERQLCPASWLGRLQIGNRHPEKPHTERRREMGSQQLEADFFQRVPTNYAIRVY